MVEQFPQTIGALLAWLAGGTGIGVVLVWLANLAVWTPLQNDGAFVIGLKRAKFLVLAIVGLALGVLATLGTIYIPSGVLEQLQPYYKLVLTVVTIIISMGATNATRFRFRAWERSINIDLEAKHARLMTSAHG